MNKQAKYKSKIQKKIESSGCKVRRARLPKRMMISAKIADALELKGWNNQVFADELGKYSSEITKWLKGDHNFTIDTLSDIEEVLQIKLLTVEERHEADHQTLILKVELSINDSVNLASEISNAGEMQVSKYEYRWS